MYFCLDSQSQVEKKPKQISKMNYLRYVAVVVKSESDGIRSSDSDVSVVIFSVGTCTGNNDSGPTYFMGVSRRIGKGRYVTDISFVGK